LKVSGPKSLAVQAAWLMAARIIGFVFTLFIPLVFSRTLNLKDFGMYKQLFLIVATSQSILPLSFSLSAFYFLPREQEPERRAAVVLNILLFHLFVGLSAALVILIYPQILVSITNAPEILAYSNLLAFVLLFWVFSYVIESLATANQDVYYSTTFIISSQLTKGMFMLGAALLTGTIRATLYAALLQGIVQSCVLLTYANFRFPRFWRHFDWRMLRTQFGYSLPFGLAGLVYTLETELHNYFVSNTFGLAAFAVYSVGTMQLPLIGVLREAIASVLLTRISYLQKQGESQEIVSLTLRVVRRLALAYWPLYALLVVTSRELITLMYTSRFLASWPIFLVNLTLIPFTVIVFDPILRAYAQYRYYLLTMRSIFLVVLLVGLSTSIQKLGLIGAVSLVIAIALAERLLIAIKIRSVLKIGRKDLRLLRDLPYIALSAAVAAVASYGVRYLVLGRPVVMILAVCGTIFGLTYALMIYWLRILTAEEMSMLQSQLNRITGRFSREKALL
jgi:O-antigen/teichoic acid export membrane protein